MAIGSGSRGLSRARYLKQRPRIEGYIRGLACDGTAVLRFARHKLRAALTGDRRERWSAIQWWCRGISLCDLAGPDQSGAGPAGPGEGAAPGLMTMCAALGP
ncbi:hypothetical protein BB934_36700 (plasmid) [Microvirga ossetica]|uniref:Uncharacterized protein n=1 Tax=Microvirga ossetica TaxID=1882682 RepID=A0A1B2EV51_9HYPH|nr:hypothetical protein BB934_36700 [Microvirga ossetica]